MEYEKIYTRENCLIAIQIWEESQTKAVKERFGWSAPLAIFNANEGVVEVYFRDDTIQQWNDLLSNKIKSDKNFVIKTMAWYSKALEPLEKSWKEQRPLANRDELIKYYDQSVMAWTGLDVAYLVPAIESASLNDKELAMKMRERSVAFLEDIDHIITKTLLRLYPQFGDKAKYLKIEEIKTGKLPSIGELEKRYRRYIYFNYEVLTGLTFDKFLKDNKILIKEERIANSKELKGQVAMKGKISGEVIVVMKKEYLNRVKEGHVLVTAMTTPDYLPAMQKAAAFVTDEGGITCHAAIVAREMKKPCVIGTKFATKLLKTGDLVEVDADKGLIRIIKSA